ncbi:MAG: hypothetical protein GWP61_03590 [Chloroflexi bacterium]|jgi:hypothetical protein|nr:hypothetical protein [Chloroflexota bacterium]
MTRTTDQSPRIIHTDAEHGGLRFVVFALLLFSLVLSFLLIQLLLNLLAGGSRLQEFSTVISCAGAIPLALGISWVMELVLKREWHSGKMLTLDDSELRFTQEKRSKNQSENSARHLVFDWAEHLNITRWYFELRGYPRAGRERRVSKRWLCLACQLQQDDDRLIVYGYIPPNQAAAWTENQQLSEPFYHISLAKLYEQAGKKGRSAATRPTIPSSMLTSADGLFWIAEQRRWREGVEVAQQDFEIFMKYVEQKL